MAIATSHTIHVALLPHSSQLNTEDESPLKLRTFQLGPTAHVLEESPLAAVLWHPLGPYGHTLVSVTSDAIVRLWEANRDDRSSFNEPAQAIDLKKLVNATSADDVFTPSKYGVSKGFSPDSIELEVAAACFGAPSLAANSNDWAPMTLWLTMKEGELYALCPFLPSKFRLFEDPMQASTLTHLTDAIATKIAAEEDDEFLDQQLQWLSELRQQDPQLVQDQASITTVHVYARPASAGAAPKLQGPFEIEPELDEEEEVCDIYVTPTDVGSTAAEEEEYDSTEDAPGSLVSLVCLLTTKAKVKVYLDIDGVAGQWLPKAKHRRASYIANEHSLLYLETIHVLPEGTSESNTMAAFTADVQSPHSLFVTHDHGVSFVSFAPWLGRLQEMLNDMQEEGASLRIDLFLEGLNSLVEHPISISGHQPDIPGAQKKISSATVLHDSDVGYFLLTTHGSQPIAAVMDRKKGRPASSDANGFEYEDDSLPAIEPRSSYQPAQAFYQQSVLPRFLEEKVPQRHRHTLKNEVRLSPATLEVLMEAHKVLSRETHNLGIAAADLFRRCERMQEEFTGQLKRAGDVSRRIDNVIGDDDDAADEEELVGKEKTEARIEAVRQKQEELVDRQDRIRRKLARVGGKELNDRERAWLQEVEKMQRLVEKPSEEDENSATTEAAPPWKRVEEVKRLTSELVEHAKEIAKQGGDDAGKENVSVPSEFRKQRIAHVMDLLERETALVDATSERLQRLNLQAV